MRLASVRTVTTVLTGKAESGDCGLPSRPQQPGTGGRPPSQSNRRSPCPLRVGARASRCRVPSSYACSRADDGRRPPCNAALRSPTASHGTRRADVYPRAGRRDRLNGGAGPDRLEGGPGRDRLVGGPGARPHRGRTWPRPPRRRPRRGHDRDLRPGRRSRWSGERPRPHRRSRPASRPDHCGRGRDVVWSRHGARRHAPLSWPPHQRLRVAAPPHA